MNAVLLDAAGDRRAPATMPGYHRGRPPRNKGEQYPADPPTVEEIVAVMRAVGDQPHGERLRALIVLRSAGQAVPGERSHPTGVSMSWEVKLYSRTSPVLGSTSTRAVAA
jgi:hypothetical protein